VEQFYIEDGVHRAVAARENGLPMLPAILHEPGAASRLIWVKLDQLHSPRVSISRSDPRHNYPALEQVMGTAAGRAEIRPIEIQPFGAVGQTGSVPLDQVVILG